MDKKVKVPLNLFTDKRVPIPNPEYLYLRQEYLNLIAQVPNDNSQELFIGGMPVQMEKGSLKQILKQKENYAITLKVDGERFLLFLASNGLIYLIDRSLTFYYFMNDDFTDRLIRLDLKPFLFDGELIKTGSNYEYLIFDVLFYNNESFIHQTYDIRYELCKFANENVFKEYFEQETEKITVGVKQWFSIDTLKKTSNIYKFIADTTNTSRKVKLKADGLILQCIDQPYVPFGPWNKYNNIQFKWKPSDQLTLDFKIKAISNHEWHLYTRTGQPYNINQNEGDPLPATCIPTDTQNLKFHDGDIVEFQFKKTGNPNQNLFTPLRLRNEKEANSLATIMSTMNVIQNPFTLDTLREPLNYLETQNPKDFKKYLNIFSQSDLILCILPDFFTKQEKKEIQKVYSSFQKQPETAELEFRIYKIGKASKTLDKFTFYYLRDYLLKNFKHTLTETIDITENKPTKLNKHRSTYNNLIKDIMEGNSIINEYKEKVTNYIFEPENVSNKLYNNLGFKLDLSIEVETAKVIKLRSQFAGKIVNNQIRVKTRHSFSINKLWRVDLTKVISGYDLASLQDKNESFECECEFIGETETPFEVFIKSMDSLFKLIVYFSNYN